MTPFCTPLLSADTDTTPLFLEEYGICVGAPVGTPTRLLRRCNVSTPSLPPTPLGSFKGGRRSARPAAGRICLIPTICNFRVMFPDGRGGEGNER
jgi:hypothetical protein